MTDPSILFWHRRDLRLGDNLGLAKARDRSAKVVGVFCLDPQILQADDIAPARVKYLLGCLQDLQKSYTRAGSELLILHANPDEGIPKLASALGARAVYWNLDVEPYSQQRDRAVRAALERDKIEVRTFWDQLLHEPDAIRTTTDKPYTVYTPFWKNWAKRDKAEPVPALDGAIALSESERQSARNAGVRELPELAELGLTWDADLLLEPGENAAREQLEWFCDRPIFDYDEQRNFPAQNGTSSLSAALKFGAIGIRTVWAATVEAEGRCRSDEARQGVETWRKELAWREFYQQVMYHFPQLAEGPYRDRWKDFPWENNEAHFQAWCEGRTGYPIVDAAMRQLNATGWMHNRCRMIVASFLTKDLIVDWRKGEKYFMQKLFDGDLSANNGGWQWSASSGMDPKPLRIFNPSSQAQKYDPDAEYIRQWVPELASMDTECLISGKISPLEREACGYPQAIVDRKVQVKRFKAMYAEVKS